MRIRTFPLVPLMTCAGLLLSTSPVIFGQTPSPAQLTLESPYLSFQVAADTGIVAITDKLANVVWGGNPNAPRFGTVTVQVGGVDRKVPLGPCTLKRVRESVEITFHPLSASPEAWIQVTVVPLPGGKGLEFRYSASGDLHVQSVELLENALWTTGAGKGYALVPVRMGLKIPADSRLEFTRTFGTYEYEGCYMAMLGLVKNGAAALITWEDPYVSGTLKSEIPRDGPLARQQVLSAAMSLRKTARSLQLYLLGEGDHMTIGHAYREIATKRGLVDRWSAKIKRNPESAKLIGAIDFKLWALLDREMNAESTEQKVLKVNWTFDEAAQVAEHLRNDLKLTRVLFPIGGWTRRGYDNQHPDIMPANPECGGNAGLAECSRRVRKLGYVFNLHDNYQDIYRDSPSWNEDLIMKNAEGALVKGGVWWGGQAYLTCSRQALALAQRPGNLPAVKEVSHANSYFIDTTYAAGLQECFDPKHPLTRADDMKWKIALSDYAREQFGIFGSEDGREWAIPHSDFMEGLVGVAGDYFHRPQLMKETGGIPIPLFEIVYRDTQAIYGKYGYDIFKSAEHVLYHVRIGRTLYYHEVPPHLYWKEKSPEPPPASAGTPDPALFVRADRGWAEGLHSFDRFVKNTYEILSPLNELTAQMQMTGFEFLTPDQKVTRTVFGEGAGRVETIVNGSDSQFSWKSRTGGEVVLPPQGFIIDSPTFAAFHALKWNGLDYDDAPLFTIRSTDGRPIDESRAVRIYHGFGDSRVRVGAVVRNVAREE
jgi:Glycosyl hydrolases related to GH101 family, GH129